MVFKRPGKPGAITFAKSLMDIALIIRIFILPLFSRFSEKRYTHCFVCNSLEFRGITIGVAYLLPDVDKL